MGMPHTKDWTVDMLAALPDDGKRYEVIDGELFVTPAPSNVHQRTVGRLYAQLLTYTDAIGLDLLTAPCAVTISDRREVQPDLLVMPKIGNCFAIKFADVGRLVLAVEVLSKRTAWVDRVKKLTLYQDERVPEYWIVDADARSVARWLPESSEPDVLTTTFVWQPLSQHAGLEIDLVEMFRKVFGE